MFPNSPLEAFSLAPGQEHVSPNCPRDGSRSVRLAAIVDSKAIEGSRFPSTTFPKFATSTSSNFANAVYPISSRFAVNHASASIASRSRVRDLLVILPAASAMRLEVFIATR
jgi:hypothetical protein